MIWLSFQECTGCTESLARSFSPSLEEMIFDLISLDYHHTLQAVSGEAAEQARRQAMRDNKGKYIVIVDGSVPTAGGGVYSTIAGQSNVAMLAETVEHAAAVIAVGTCAAFGGLPEADPNPTGAVPVSKLVTGKPLINIPGCPPMPQAMAGTLVHLLSFGKPPELDALLRPLAFFGETIHDRCYRRPVLQARSVREELRRRRCTQGLVPVRTGLQGAGHLQRLRLAEMERRRVLPDPVRPRLHRLFGATLLGPRRPVQGAADRHRRAASGRADRRSQRRRAWRGRCRAGATGGWPQPHRRRPSDGTARLRARPGA